MQPHQYNFVDFGHFDPYHRTGPTPRYQCSVKANHTTVVILDTQRLTPNLKNNQQLLKIAEDREKWLRAELHRLNNFIAHLKQANSFECSGGK